MAKPEVNTFQFCKETLKILGWWEYRGQSRERAMCDGCAMVHPNEPIWFINLRPVVKMAGLAAPKYVR